jgi:uncharacterized membrane protein
MKMKDEQAELDTRIRGLDDREIFLMLGTPQDYCPAALAIAEDERHLRGLSDPPPAIADEIRSVHAARIVKGNDKKRNEAAMLGCLPSLLIATLIVVPLGLALFAPLALILPEAIRESDLFVKMIGISILCMYMATWQYVSYFLGKRMGVREEEEIEQETGEPQHPPRHIR